MPSSRPTTIDIARHVKADRVQLPLLGLSLTQAPTLAVQLERQHMPALRSADGRLPLVHRHGGARERRSTPPLIGGWVHPSERPLPPRGAPGLQLGWRGQGVGQGRGHQPGAGAGAGPRRGEMVDDEATGMGSGDGGLAFVPPAWLEFDAGLGLGLEVDVSSRSQGGSEGQVTPVAAAHPHLDVPYGASAPYLAPADPRPTLQPSIHARLPLALSLSSGMGLPSFPVPAPAPLHAPIPDTFWGVPSLPPFPIGSSSSAVGPSVFPAQGRWASTAYPPPYASVSSLPAHLSGPYPSFAAAPPPPAALPLASNLADGYPAQGAYAAPYVPLPAGHRRSSHSAASAKEARRRSRQLAQDPYPRPVGSASAPRPAPPTRQLSRQYPAQASSLMPMLLTPMDTRLLLAEQQGLGQGVDARAGVGGGEIRTAAGSSPTSSATLVSPGAEAVGARAEDGAWGMPMPVAMQAQGSSWDGTLLLTPIGTGMGEQGSGAVAATAAPALGVWEVGGEGTAGMGGQAVMGAGEWEEWMSWVADGAGGWGGGAQTSSIPLSTLVPPSTSAGSSGTSGTSGTVGEGGERGKMPSASGSKAEKAHRRERVPDEQRRHMCNLCGSRFVRDADLRRHHQTKHVDPTRWSHCCPNCPLRFARPDKLRKHVEACRAGVVSLAIGTAPFF